MFVFPWNSVISKCSYLFKLFKLFHLCLVMSLVNPLYCSLTYGKCLMRVVRVTPVLS